jgi:4-hydroxy-tetrahydrodipicolinate synthase
LCKAALAGDLSGARALNNRLLPLHLKLFVEPNPVPVKWALKRMGRIDGAIRLPLVPLSEANQPAVEAALREVSLI